MNEKHIETLTALRGFMSPGGDEAVDAAISALRKQGRYEALRQASAMLVSADRAQALTTELVDRLAKALAALENE